MSSSALRADLQARPCMSYFQDLWEQRASAVRSEALLRRVSPQSHINARGGAGGRSRSLPRWPGDDPERANDQCPPAPPCPWRGVISRAHFSCSVTSVNTDTVVTTRQFQV
jgi:hypothetical protein